MILKFSVDWSRAVILQKRALTLISCVVAKRFGYTWTTQGAHNLWKKRSIMIPIKCDSHVVGINRIYHQSPMQTEKSQPNREILTEGKQIMPEMRFTPFPALSVDPRVGISRSALKTNIWLFFLPVILKIIKYNLSFLSFMTFYDS